MSTKHNAIASQDPPVYRAGPGYSQKTADRLRAYVASIRPLRGVEVWDSYHVGRALIERLALSAKGERMPSLKLSAAQCADVLHFIAGSEPIEPEDWWKDPENAPSHMVGFIFALQAVEDSLRSMGVQS